MTRPIKGLTGAVATGDSSHFGTNDLDQVNNLLNGQDQSTPGPSYADPTNAVTMNTLWAYANQKLQFKNPSNTATSTVVSPNVSTNSNFQFNTTPDYYVFMDPDDGSKIKCRNGRTGAIESTHATNADVPLQYAIDQLTVNAGSAIQTSGDSIYMWTGGTYGKILVGPGTFYFYKAVILRSNLVIQGSGSMTTKFTWPNSLYPGVNNNTLHIFKSSYWDINSYGANGTTNAQLLQGDVNVTLRDFEIYGNWKNNVLPVANTATTTGTGADSTHMQTAGADSWGHGIAYYGSVLRCENLNIHGCPGAGIIIQKFQQSGLQLGSAWTYPLIPNGYSTAQTGVGMYDEISYVLNCNSWANGRQGLLVRAYVFVDNFWSYQNGEPGIDCQTCAYFGGTGWFSHLELFSDSAIHGDGSYSQSTNTSFTNTTYDPLGYEARFRGWVNDSWIEGPWGPGDCLSVGTQNGNSTASGWQIQTNDNNVQFNNLHLDTLKFNAVYVGQNSTRNQLRQIYVCANCQPEFISACPLTVIGSYNDIDIRWGALQGTAVNGVTLGSLSPSSVATVGNRIAIFSDANTYNVNNQNAGNSGNNINLFLNNAAGAATKYILQPGGQTFNTTNNKLMVETGAGTLTGLLSHNGGLQSASGDGSTTAFTWAHNLFATPAVVSVNPATADARGEFIVSSLTSTSITITYAVAPPSGAANNVQLYWSARVSP